MRKHLNDDYLIQDASFAFFMKFSIRVTSLAFNFWRGSITMEILKRIVSQFLPIFHCRFCRVCTALLSSNFCVKCERCSWTDVRNNIVNTTLFFLYKITKNCMKSCVLFLVFGPALRWNATIMISYLLPSWRRMRGGGGKGIGYLSMSRQNTYKNSRHGKNKKKTQIFVLIYLVPCIICSKFSCFRFILLFHKQQLLRMQSLPSPVE